MTSTSKMIGKRAEIKDRSSWYFGEWGTIIDVDDDGCFYIAIADDKTSVPVFTRDQIKIRRI